MMYHKAEIRPESELKDCAPQIVGKQIEGVTYIVGEYPNGMQALQSVLFDAKKFSPVDVMVWLVQRKMPASAVQYSKTKFEKFLGWLYRSEDVKGKYRPTSAVTKRRYYLLSTKWLTIYFERLLLQDWEPYLQNDGHGHIFIPIKGSYEENYANSAEEITLGSIKKEKSQLFGVHIRKPEQPLRIESTDKMKGAWRLCISGKKLAPDGFHTPQGFVDTDHYFTATRNNMKFFEKKEEPLVFVPGAKGLN